MGKYILGILIIGASLSINFATCQEELTCFDSGNTNSSEIVSTNLTSSKLNFTLEMFHKLYEQQPGSNLFFSPHSIHQALMLAFFGAKGETETELRSALKIAESTPKSQLIHQYKMDNYFRETACVSAGAEFRVANKLYFSKDEPLTPCMTKVFDKEVEQVDFKNGSEARDKINNWVETQTSGKIQNLIPAPLPESSRMAIVNSAYFKGVWEQQFKKSKTKLGLFYAKDDEVIPTQMMHAKGNFRHGVSEEMRAYILEMPYEGQSLSMFIILPPFVPNALLTTISNLNADSLARAMDDMIHDSLEVVIPRFKMSQEMELRQALSSIGISSLFNSSSSDLSGYSSQPGLSVDEALHKSFIEVNEEGATAAAATALISTRIARPLDQTRFVANHPFLFTIYDHCSKSILFIGALHKPSSSKA